MLPFLAYGPSINSVRQAFGSLTLQLLMHIMLVKYIQASYITAIRPPKKVIHKLSTLVTKIGRQDSFPIGLRSVTMKWGKVGNFGEVVVWR
jgi:hypothetical protein